MHPRSFRPRTFLLSLLLGFAALSPAGAAEKIKVLLITGGHAFEKEPFYQLFAANPELSVTRAEHDTKVGATAYEREDLYSFDVVVAYDMPAKSSPAQRARFQGLFPRGIGYVALHHAILSFEDWPEYERIVGGRYPKPPKGQPQVTDVVGYQHGVDVPVRVTGPAHPIIAGVKEFTIHDEIYWGVRIGKDIAPFLVTTHPKSMNPLGWTRTEGKSRVAFLQLGHDHFAYEHPAYRQLVAQAIRWAAQR